MSARRSAAAVVVLVTCPSPAVAKRIARHLVKQRLAACVNTVPGLQSIFRWQGRVDRCSEALLLIKTTRPVFLRLKTAILALHPYEVPEIIALPVHMGHQPYLRWIARSLSC